MIHGEEKPSHAVLRLKFHGFRHIGRYQPKIDTFVIFGGPLLSAWE